MTRLGRSTAEKWLSAHQFGFLGAGPSLAAQARAQSLHERGLHPDGSRWTPLAFLPEHTSWHGPVWVVSLLMGRRYHAAERASIQRVPRAEGVRLWTWSGSPYEDPWTDIADEPGDGDVEALILHDNDLEQDVRIPTRLINRYFSVEIVDPDPSNSHWNEVPVGTVITFVYLNMTGDFH